MRGKLNYVGVSALPLQDYVDGSDLQGLNGLDFNFNAGLSQPRIWQFLPARVGARLNVTAERVHRPTYFYGRVAGLLGVDWAVTRWLQITGSYLIENVLVRAQADVGRAPRAHPADRRRAPPLPHRQLLHADRGHGPDLRLPGRAGAPAFGGADHHDRAR